jgi:flagellar protein FlbD
MMPAAMEMPEFSFPFLDILYSLFTPSLQVSAGRYARFTYGSPYEKEPIVIALTHFNNTLFYLNAELIRCVEATPDTLITLINDTKMMVREPVDLVVERVIAYRRSVNTPLVLADQPAADSSGKQS